MKPLYARIEICHPCAISLGRGDRVEFVRDNRPLNINRLTVGCIHRAERDGYPITLLEEEIIPPDLDKNVRP